MSETVWPRLRMATNQDAGQITDLVYSVLAEYGLGNDPGGTDADLKDIEQAYLIPSGVFRVIETEDRAIVGTYGLCPTAEDSCELRKMYLRREYRGKGWGKRLLDDALANARRLGFRQVTLETASVLTEAIGLYKSYGFLPYRVDHLSARCDQAYVLYLV